MQNIAANVTSTPSINDSLVELLQGIHRFADIKSSHFEALKVNAISNASAQEIIPDPRFLPPLEEWDLAPHKEPVGNNEIKTRRGFYNDKPIHFYRHRDRENYEERRKQLLTENENAFRDIRNSRYYSHDCLGRGYIFFQKLQRISDLWAEKPRSAETDWFDTDRNAERSDPFDQLADLRRPNEARPKQGDYQDLVESFVKIFSSDLCLGNIINHAKPRLSLTPPKSASAVPSHVTSDLIFIYKPIRYTRIRRRKKGPLAALSVRQVPPHAQEMLSSLYLSKELVFLLMTAQYRAREHKTETRIGAGKWWTSIPRWGGGPGGLIGFEAQGKVPLSPKYAHYLPRLRTEREFDNNEHMKIYRPYRDMKPPASTWDPSVDYRSIGKVEGSNFDDVFLVSSLNSSLRIVRARVPDTLLRVLDGEKGLDWDRLTVWTSRWFDLFVARDRVEALDLIWGMEGWLLRNEELN